MVEAMESLFERMLGAWSQTSYLLPAIEPPEDSDPSFWESISDEGWATWRPKEKSVFHDLEEIAPNLGPWPPELSFYVNSYWFAQIDTGIDQHGVSLFGVVPGVEVRDIVTYTDAYQHNRKQKGFAIGAHMEGLQVILDPTDGRIFADDWQNDSQILLADGMESLFQNSIF